MAASYKTDIDLQGVKEIRKAIEAIPEGLEKKVMRNATAKSMTPVSKKGRANMRRHSSTVAKAIGKKTKQYKGGTTITIVGVRSDTKPTRKTRTITLPNGEILSTTTKFDPRNVAHLIEGGTKPHQIRIPWLNISTAHPGTKAERPIGKALESEKSKIVRILKTEILTGVETITKREARRRGNARA